MTCLQVSDKHATDELSQQSKPSFDRAAAWHVRQRTRHELAWVNAEFQSAYTVWSTGNLLVDFRRWFLANATWLAGECKATGMMRANRHPASQTNS